jgi:alkylated DNA repair protein alkB family protein 8
VNEEDSQFATSHKNIYLPNRSLLILSGDARYKWLHGIRPRKSDKVNGLLIPRQRRVSFTFRHVLIPGSIPTQKLITGEVEKEHVTKVYDAIAIHWNHTRGKRKVHWLRVKSFIESLSEGSLLADVGSGDGKYFGVNPNIVTIGCDRSLQLLKVSCDDQRIQEAFCCDAVLLPLLSDAFDAVICIAVLHHIATIERRFNLIRELVRISRVNGIIFVQAWALEQEEDSKHRFSSQDTMVPWKLPKRFVNTETNAVQVDEKESKTEISTNQDAAEITVYQRYCHVYKEGELEDLCSRVPNCQILESGYEKGNWFVKLQKIEDIRLAMAKIGAPSVSVPSTITRISNLPPL